MTEFYICHACDAVRPLIENADRTKCGSCGSTNGHVISKEEFDQSYKAGAIFPIDPRTGKRKKKEP